MASAPWLRAIAAAGALVLATGARLPQGAGTIRGRVDTSAAIRSAPRPHVADVSMLASMTRDAPVRRPSVVYLEEGPRGAFTDLPPARARLDQRHEQFVPHILAITAGTTVDFPNNDLTFHNVFSLSPVTHFDLGRYPVGQSRSVRFDRAGIIPVFCDIHSHMSAYILVFSHPFFALTDDDGRYAISGVPAGSYSLLVWSEAGRADGQRVTVPENGTVEATFRIGRQRE